MMEKRPIGLRLRDVPVDGFTSISVYNAKGFFEKNDLDAYSLNNLTAKANADGSYTVQFGGCSKTSQNCLPNANGWNYAVRLYRGKPFASDARTWTCQRGTTSSAIPAFTGIPTPTKLVGGLYFSACSPAMTRA